MRFEFTAAKVYNRSSVSSFLGGAMIAKAVLFILAVAYLCPVHLMAQDNYEIQVYGADTVEPAQHHGGIPYQLDCSRRKKCGGWRPSHESCRA